MLFKITYLMVPLRGVTSDNVTVNSNCYEICDNCIDDDGDGLVDCFDTSCACLENDTDGDGILDSCDSEDCEDGVDNDGDGLVDCFDTDCAPAGFINGETYICQGVLTELKFISTLPDDNYQYNWDNGATDQSIFVGEGFYNLTVTNEHGCQSSASFIVSESNYLDSDGDGDCDNEDEDPNNPCERFELFEASIIGDFSLCLNQTTDLEVVVYGADEPYNILWNNGTTEEVLSNVGADTYTITVTDNRGCSRITSIEVVESAFVDTDGDGLCDDEDPAPNFICEMYGSFIGEALVCNGGAAEISVEILQGAEPFIYNWSDGSTTASVILPVGYYTCEVIDANGCLFNEGIAIDQGPPEELELLITTGDSPCIDGTRVESNFNETEWFDDQGNNIGSGSTFIFNKGVGIYTARHTNNNGCISEAEFELESSVSDFKIIPDAAIYCGNPITLSVDEEYDFYTWNVNGEFEFTQSIIVDEPGIYEVEVLSLEDGCEVTKSVEVFENTDSGMESYLLSIGFMEVVGFEFPGDENMFREGDKKSLNDCPNSIVNFTDLSQSNVNLETNFREHACQVVACTDKTIDLYLSSSSSLCDESLDNNLLTADQNGSSYSMFWHVIENSQTGEKKLFQKVTNKDEFYDDLYSGDSSLGNAMSTSTTYPGDNNQCVSGRSSNHSWAGWPGIFGSWVHLAIEERHISTTPTAWAEVRINNTRFRVDIMDPTLGHAYEIKAFGNEAIGITQLQGYIRLLNKNCAPPSTWKAGPTKPSQLIPVPSALSPFGHRYVRYVYEPSGIIVYTDRNGSPVNQFVPQHVLDDVNRFVSKYYEKLKNGFIVTDREIQEWLHRHPNVARILRDFTGVIIIGIFVTNFIQNVATLCAGCADDVAVYAAIAYLRRVAKLAKVTTKLCPL